MHSPGHGEGIRWVLSDEMCGCRLRQEEEAYFKSGCPVFSFSFRKLPWGQETFPPPLIPPSLHPLKTHPFIHPSKHLRFTHRFFYPSKSSATHSPTQPPINPSAPKLILPSLHSPVHLFNPQMHPSTHPALHSFTDPLVSLFFPLPKMSHHKLPLSPGKRRLIQSPQPLTGKGRLLQTWASPGSGPGLR